jgi:hypothetical protein
MKVEPQDQHRWLEKLLGEWTTEMPDMSNADNPSSIHGRETVRSVGGLWVIGEGEGEMPGGGVGRTVITLGYDTMANRFVGSFIGSMMTQMWIYQGQLEGNRLVLDTEGPNFEQDGLAKYQDVIEFVSDDHRTLQSRIQLPSGEWKHFMTAHYRRK